MDPRCAEIGGGEGEYRPSNTPALDKTRLAVSIWRLSRPRPVPRALRTANSFLRVASRANSRFKRFTKTISKVRPTPHHKAISERRSLLAT